MKLHLLNLSLQFHYNRKTGSILSTIERAQQAFPELMNALFSQLLPIILEVTIAITVICKLYNFHYGATLLVTIILYLISTLFTVKQSVKAQFINNEKQNNVSSYLLDTLLNFETVKYFNNTQYEYQQCDTILKE